MSFEEFQAWIKARMFSQRRMAWRSLQFSISQRHPKSGLIAYPDCLLFATPEDFGFAMREVEEHRRKNQEEFERQEAKNRTGDDMPKEKR